jgi:hypothetical protein
MITGTQMKTQLLPTLNGATNTATSTPNAQHFYKDYLFKKTKPKSDSND